MFDKNPNCSVYGEKIEGDDVVYIKMRYPKRRGMTEIKAYLKNKGAFLCETCFRHQSN